MISRSLYPIVFAGEWGRQMRFVIGLRQAGKTTLAREKLRQENSQELYYLWDLRKVREKYKENELFFTQDGTGSRSKKNCGSASARSTKCRSGKIF